MKRIIMHWTGGAHKASDVDMKAYHFIVQGDGSLVAGDHEPEANENTRTAYAAHTWKLNTGSIGVSVAAMADAKERPFQAGAYPITKKQIERLVKVCAFLAEKYGIPVTRKTVLTHAEVQPTLGVKQKNKWDITWLPGMDKPGDPIEVGDKIRARILAEMKTDEVEQPPPKPTGLAALIAAILGIFGR